jgi:hypothetical protein
MTIASSLASASYSASSETESEALSRIATQNFAVSASLRATAWALTASGLRAFRPELSETQVQDEVRAQFRRASG